MTTDGSAAPAGRPEQHRGDPLQMTEAEKRIAEWEARHDVAARGRSGPPDVVQHYVAHERLAEARAAGATAARPHAAVPPAGVTGAGPVPAPRAGESAPPRSRSWRLFRRLRRGGN